MRDNSFLFEEGVKESKSTLSPKEVILSLLRAKNWTQAELGKQIGLSRQAINNYLRGHWEFPTPTKIKIAQALGVDSAVIWDLEEKKNG